MTKLTPYSFIAYTWLCEKFIFLFFSVEFYFFKVFRPIKLTMSDYSTSDSEEELTIADDYVVTKYKMAGQMNDS